MINRHSMKNYAKTKYRYTKKFPVKFPPIIYTQNEGNDLIMGLLDYAKTFLSNSPDLTSTLQKK